jgi:RimJ/RimL family protein N-acetyltransferase
MTTDVQAPAFKRTYPRDVRLPDGKTLSLRLMNRGDVDALVTFARALPKKDLLFLRRDITDRHNVEEWATLIETGKTVSVLAFDDEKIAGYATLHHNEALWTRHVGEIRTNVAADYRAMRLGSLLVEEMFQIAKDLGLRKITANMVADQKAARAAFERIGFHPEALLADHVVDAEGRTHDMLIMSFDIEGFND